MLSTRDAPRVDVSSQYQHVFKRPSRQLRPDDMDHWRSLRPAGTSSNARPVGERVSRSGRRVAWNNQQPTHRGAHASSRGRGSPQRTLSSPRFGEVSPRSASSPSMDFVPPQRSTSAADLAAAEQTCIGWEAWAQLTSRGHAVPVPKMAPGTTGHVARIVAAAAAGIAALQVRMGEELEKDSQSERRKEEQCELRQLRAQVAKLLDARASDERNKAAIVNIKSAEADKYFAASPLFPPRAAPVENSPLPTLLPQPGPVTDLVLNLAVEEEPEDVNREAHEEALRAVSALEKEMAELREAMMGEGRDGGS